MNSSVNKNLPLVTVITPAYNHAPYIRKNIENVLTQDYPKSGVPLEFAESHDWWRVKIKRNGQKQFIKPSIPSRVLNKISAHFTD